MSRIFNISFILRVKPREYVLGEEKDKTFDEAEEICKSKGETGLATVRTEEDFSDAMLSLLYILKLVGLNEKGIVMITLKDVSRWMELKIVLMLMLMILMNVWHIGMNMIQTNQIMNV